MKFSKIQEAIKDPTQLYHITPRDNVESIQQNGLVRGSKRNTQGTETKQQIYLTSSLYGIDNPFPHHDLWWMKNMYVFEVDTGKINKSKLTLDPEYNKGQFWMLDDDVKPSGLHNMGPHVFHTNKEKSIFSGLKYNGTKI